MRILGPFAVACLAAFVLFIVIDGTRAQEANSVPVSAAQLAQALANTSGAAPASSTRYAVPLYADDPGTEGALAIGPDRLYSYHSNLWGWSPRVAMQTRPAATPTPTP